MLLLFKQLDFKPLWAKVLSFLSTRPPDRLGASHGVNDESVLNFRTVMASVPRQWQVRKTGKIRVQNPELPLTGSTTLVSFLRPSLPIYGAGLAKIRGDACGSEHASKCSSITNNDGSGRCGSVGTGAD